MWRAVRVRSLTSRPWTGRARARGDELARRRATAQVAGGRGATSSPRGGGAADPARAPRLRGQTRRQRERPRAALDGASGGSSSLTRPRVGVRGKHPSTERPAPWGRHYGESKIADEVSAEVRARGLEGRGHPAKIFIAPSASVSRSLDWLREGVDPILGGPEPLQLLAVEDIVDASSGTPTARASARRQRRRARVGTVRSRFGRYRPPDPAGRPGRAASRRGACARSSCPSGPLDNGTTAPPPGIVRRRIEAERLLGSAALSNEQA